MVGIYTIRNKTNNKYYVGLSVDVNKRFSEHRNALKGNYHLNEYLQRAWNKYGESSFEFELLEECNEELLFAMEHYWSMLLNSHHRDYGYNVEPTSPNGKNRLAESTKEKISIIRKEQYKDPTNNPFYGKKHSEETKKKMSLSGRGKKKKPWSEETRVKILTSRARTYKTKRNAIPLGYN